MQQSRACCSCFSQMSLSDCMWSQLKVTAASERPLIALQVVEDTMSH